MTQQSGGSSRKCRKQKSSKKRANLRKTGKHARGQKRKIGRGIGMIADTVMEEIARLDQITRMIGTGVIVAILPDAIQIDMTTDQEVERGARHLGGKGIIVVATIVQGERGMIVHDEIDIAVNA